MTTKDKLDQALTALTEIAQLGANPITGHGCNTRADFMRHCDKMWLIAFACVNTLDSTKNECSCGVTEDRSTTCPHCNADILPAEMEVDHCTQCGEDLE